MTAISAWDLLALWEQGYGRSAVQKALLLISAAWPDTSMAQAAALPVGERDGRLLTLRERLFGVQFEGVVHCPECGEQLELSFQTSDIRVTGETAVSDPLSLNVDGYQVRFRLPTTQDLLVIDAGLSSAENQRRLLERCLLEVRYEGNPETAVYLPSPVINAVAAQMAAADPQADVQINLTCPACAYEWPVAFDIVSFLWQELHTWAMRTLRDVHQLAAAYGWSERDILQMSAWRRQLYMQMVG